MKRLCFLIHLPQDLDLLAPIIESSLDLKRPLICLVYKKLLLKSPRLKVFLQKTKAPWVEIDPRKNFLKAIWHISQSDVLLSAVETSVKPHTFGYFFTKWANRLGKKTFTLQHGLENIGLTYSDEDYPIKNIHFASKKILIWSKTSELHAETPIATKKKCVPFGCTKNFFVLDRPAKPHPFVVSVFENLHWSRYSNDYKQNFLHQLEQVTSLFPEIRFLIKPHHEGRWLTERSKQLFKFPSHVDIIDPSAPTWEPYTGPAIISISDIVITTPSTIALDACVAGKPTLIFGDQLDLARYSPLPILHNLEDWQKYISLAHKTKQHFDPLNKAFLERSIVTLDCIQNLADLFEDGI